jgi:hypothetical protein
VHGAAAVAELRRREHWARVAHGTHDAAARLHEGGGDVLADDGVDHGAEGGCSAATDVAGGGASQRKEQPAAAAPQTCDAGLKAEVRENGTT